MTEACALALVETAAVTSGVVRISEFGRACPSPPLPATREHPLEARLYIRQTARGKCVYTSEYLHVYAYYTRFAKRFVLLCTIVFVRAPEKFN